MSDTTPNPADTTPVEGKEGDAPKGDEGGKTFSQEDINEIVSKRVKKAETKYAQELEKARQEWEQEAKLSQQEREKLLEEKKSKQLTEKERELNIKENRFYAMDRLIEKSLPKELSDYVVSENQEEVDSKIEQLTKVWQAEIDKAVQAKLQGQTPKDPISKNNKNTATQFEGYM